MVLPLPLQTSDHSTRRTLMSRASNGRARVFSRLTLRMRLWTPELELVDSLIDVCVPQAPCPRDAHNACHRAVARRRGRTRVGRTSLRAEARAATDDLRKRVGRRL